MIAYSITNGEYVEPALYEAYRNKTLTTATLVTINKNDGSTELMKATISDAAGTTTKEEFVSG